MMHAQSLLALVLLCTSVWALPARHQPKGRSFKVERIRRRNYVPNGPAALQKAYNKFGMVGHDFTPDSNRTLQDDIGPLSAVKYTANSGTSGSPPQYDAEFLDLVNIAGQTLAMDFDTGSADMSVILLTISVSC